jgi:predicted RNA methylase
LPPGNLDRSLYMQVKKAVELAGGRWKTGPQAFVFDCDPRPKFGLMLESGVAVDEKQKFQFFATPPDIAEEMVLRIGVTGCSVLEPSAGHGALANECRRRGALSITCFDINPECVSKLKAAGFTAKEADFLGLNPSRKFDRIIMNPPFTRGADLKHIAAALKWLKRDGILVSIMLKNKDEKTMEKLLAGWDYSIRDLPPGAFKKSGTSVETCELTVHRVTF